MGKRSSFERRERDFYPTPYEAVVPLLAHLAPGTKFCEPCYGDGALAMHLEGARHRCVLKGDIADETSSRWADARISYYPVKGFGATHFITNPPWSRDILHPIIVNLSDQLPTWLLFDADWIHTKQAAPYLSRLVKVVSVGRVKWIPDSPHTGKDNCAWYLFDWRAEAPPVFYGRAA